MLITATSTVITLIFPTCACHCAVLCCVSIIVTSICYMFFVFSDSSVSTFLQWLHSCRNIIVLPSLISFESVLSALPCSRLSLLSPLVNLMQFTCATVTITVTVTAASALGGTGTITFQTRSGRSMFGPWICRTSSLLLTLMLKLA